MAEEADESGQTEQPTPQRLQEARRRGQVASSREVVSFLLLAVTVLAWAALAPVASARLTLALGNMLGRAGTLRMDATAVGHLLLEALGLLGLAAGVPLLLYLAAPVIAAALQGALVWSTENFGMKLERISPSSGFSRLFSGKTLLEYVKGLLKLGAAGGALYAALWPEHERILASASLPPTALLELLRGLVLKLLATGTAVIGLLAVLDYAHARLMLTRRLRMSRREVLEEHKQNEGDPIVRQRLKATRMERASRRMMADVPKSTVVITNPTHYAVALRYVAGETAAPEVLAKGVDEVALRIREVAAAHKVPIIENPPLARALHAACEPGTTIPAAHYQAVAEIIGYVLRLRSPR